MSLINVFPEACDVAIKHMRSERLIRNMNNI